MNHNTDTVSANTAASYLEIFPTDPAISYPSYKSMDEFMDVERLKALDGYIATRLKRRLTETEDVAFYTGPYKLQQESLAVPGTRMVYLSRSTRPDRYLDLDQPGIWELTEDATEFALLMDFIRTLPFKSTGRMLIMYDTEPRPVSAHRDHMETDICHDFIWFRTNKRKPFYMLNHTTGEKQYVASYSAWFDSVNQFHGSDPYEGLSFSIRVDGIFTDEFKALIPVPDLNIASTPSFWACLAHNNTAI
jgi:hypothetical protein